MLRMFYISAARRLVTASELGDILAVSRKRNRVDGVTGVILYQEGSFAQVLEGPEDAVRACFARIEKDRRHSGCALILEEKADARLFEDWDMEIVSMVRMAAMEKHGVMTLKAFQQTPQFRAVQGHLVLKSFMKGFADEPAVKPARETVRDRNARFEKLMEEETTFSGAAGGRAVADDIQFTDQEDPAPGETLHAMGAQMSVYQNRTMIGDGAFRFRLDAGEAKVAFHGVAFDHPNGATADEAAAVEPRHARKLLEKLLSSLRAEKTDRMRLAEMIKRSRLVL